MLALDQIIKHAFGYTLANSKYSISVLNETVIVYGNCAKIRLYQAKNKYYLSSIINLENKIAFNYTLIFISLVLIFPFSLNLIKFEFSATLAMPALDLGTFPLLLSAFRIDFSLTLSLISSYSLLDETRLI